MVGAATDVGALRPVRPTHVVAVVGPGEWPDGCREASERRAAVLGIGLRWVEVADEDAAAQVVRTAAGDGAAVLLASGTLADRQAVAAAAAQPAVPVVHVDTVPVTIRGPVRQACDRVIHGRGRASFTWALRWLATAVDRPGLVHAYGPDRVNQVAELRLPDPAVRVPSVAADTGTWPVVLLVHGGFWLDWWQRDLMDGLAVGLTRRGWATWNLEYRRTGPSGGGWPGSLEDACAGVDAIADVAADHPLDLARVVLIGHSAGAQLAAYATARSRLPARAPGCVPRVAATGFVSLAGVLDLDAAAAQDLGAGAVRAYLGDPAQRTDRVRLGSPQRLVPLGVDSLVVHGIEDRLVPPDHSRGYAELAALAGDDVTLELVAGDHFTLIDPTDAASDTVLGWLEAR